MASGRCTRFAQAAAEAAAEASGGAEGAEEEELCAICYTGRIDTVFSPCNHRSCRRCIDRQRLNNPRCFFCNVAVESLEDLPLPVPSA